MKLRAKLFLYFGILLLLMAVPMYIFPTYIVRKDISEASSSVHEIIIKDHRKLIDSQEIWLRDVLQRMKENNNAILFMIYEERDFRTRFVLSKQNPLKNTWNAAASLVSYDPDIGFVQLHSPKENKTAVIMPHESRFYPVSSIDMKDNMVGIVLGKDSMDYIYVGKALTDYSGQETLYTYYALVDYQNAASELKELQKEIEKIKPDLIEKKTLDIGQIALEKSHALSWAIKMDMLQLLTPLFVEGLALKETNVIPAGIARIDKSGKGMAILSQDIFKKTPLFDDKTYYETNIPPSSAPPLAENSTLVFPKHSGHIFFANTLLIDSTLITIGAPVDPLAKQLALSSDKTILVRSGGEFIAGFDGNGRKLDELEFTKFEKDELLSQKDGMVSIEGKNYYFSRLRPFGAENLIFYNLHLASGQSIMGMLMTLEKSLTDRISIQMLLISIVIIILILIFVIRISRAIVAPITLLAKATEDVVAGRYEEVLLPKVGKRKDEVATLSRSFADMVKGLQEKEKIRGVLNKVVSKDIADEILKSSIHLGGEDRIVSMLFCDIRGFTNLTENLSPQKTIQMLNACMTKISYVIEQKGGVIDKFVGDEIMALFGAPTTHSDNAVRAISAGVLVIKTLKKWNLERKEQGDVPIEMGVGVHTGLVVAGNMGAEDRLNYTVLGSNVNLAARLCSLAKPNQLIISENTLNEPNVKESFVFELLSSITLKGFTEPINTYQILGFKAK